MTRLILLKHKYHSIWRHIYLIWRNEYQRIIYDCHQDDQHSMMLIVYHIEGHQIDKLQLVHDFCIG